MALGDRVLSRGATGDDVVDLQICLAGFRGTVPDGDFGPGTELQVTTFQRDFLGHENPSGVADRAVIDGLRSLAEQHPLDFEALHCPCGKCEGFGQGRNRGKYRPGLSKAERHYLYEYPGIHRMILWAVRGVFHYAPQFEFSINSGYRCATRNKQTGRSSTNHHGKAIDIDMLGDRGKDNRLDMERCDEVRGLIVEHATAQVGWHANNRKALEPSDIAPTWVHYDVRCYADRYLQDHFFCRSRAELDSVLG